MPTFATLEEARTYLDEMTGRFCPEEHRWLSRTEKVVTRNTSTGPVSAIVTEN